MTRTTYNGGWPSVALRKPMETTRILRMPAAQLEAEIERLEGEGWSVVPGTRTPDMTESEE